MDELLDAMLDRTRPLCIIHGNARGADLCAASWARRRGILDFPFPARWDLYGRSAGYERNKTMLYDGKPDLVIGFPGGEGTWMMTELARRAGVEMRRVR